ncbi:MAG: Shikimate kinase [Fimbriimonadaceae bacterium]|nr:Shikimate kinase [Fimbriimonadaceae bacterium]
MDRAWILVGMMGSGKSTIGRAMAAASKREFVDSDMLLQHRLGHSVARLFAVYGEAAFRDHETALLRSLDPGAYVLATGGGIVQREANWIEMRRLGLTVFLDVKTEVLLERLERGRHRRPLLVEEGWEQRVLDLLSRRRPLYEQAEIHLHLHGDDPETVARIAIEEIERHG